MSKNDNVIKNPARQVPRPQAKYEPEYRRLGREPKAMIDFDRKLLDKTSNKIIDDLTEPTISSIDGIDYDIDGGVVSSNDSHIIDNNEFVFYENHPYTYFPPVIKNNEFSKPTTNTVIVSPDNQGLSDIPKIGEYVLMLDGDVICVGNAEEVQSKIENIIYNDDRQSSVQNTNDIVVLKRVEVKIGVFIG